MILLNTRQFFNHLIYNNVKRLIFSRKFSTKSLYFADKFDPNEERFNKVLIANRGEIACRVIRTCKSMGIKTVAIYSEIDSRALHVQHADEAYCVGPAPSGQSYLNVDVILDVIRKSGAEAVHPGYGFLSENTDFAQKLSDMGIVFVGPNSHSVHAMGDKIESKLIANKAKVNTIPGFEGVIKDAEHCVQLAREIGYPVMIKASAGGGGKGMRMAYNDQEAFEGFRFSKNEAMSSFNDDRLLIEKFIEEPRHIEIQVLCDKHGNGIYLNERECSIQRRNQKVIEEAPSTFVDPELRKAMGEQAIALAKNVGYDSAGTVEFLVDKNKNFYFLEMNTRLQVEHPITEYICGIDIVHHMLRVAKGHKLRHRQEDVQLRGWAIESRVYAENPYKNFGLPSIGRLTRYCEPTFIDSNNVRCDSGVIEGSDINIYYDPLICKLITYGNDRKEALSTMAKSLDNYVIRGLIHNIPLLRDIITEPNFVDGHIDTKYLPRIYPDGFKGRQMNDERIRDLTSIAVSIFLRKFYRSKHYVENDTIPLDEDSIKKHTLFVDLSENLNIQQNDDQQQKVIKTDVEFNELTNQFKIYIDNELIAEFPSNFSLAKLTLDFQIDKKIYTVQLISVNHDGYCQIQFEGTIFNIRVMSEKAYNYLQIIPPKPKIDARKIIKSPMPGVVKSIAVNVGDEVNEGQELCVIEAMKMQNSMIAESNGIVKKINCKINDTVEGEQILLQLE
uniref:propionyl-CoA carboxylase n=1 Tax=Dermatophagoides pteronyssinus TaxID=6956 RepID=A0A6P6YGW8_DERPT|nr:propionyl-CoA carboxylase alpha chain, mitochondrial-like [Dermatophagoides pteronyssinus]